jgi:MATE family multidrug resistance protein
MPYLVWACLIPIAGMAAFIYDGIFIGLTATRGMLLSSIAATVAFFAILFAGNMLSASCHLAYQMTNHVLWFSFTIYLLMRGMMQHVLLRRLLQ